MWMNQGILMLVLVAAVRTSTFQYEVWNSVSEEAAFQFYKQHLDDRTVIRALSLMSKVVNVNQIYEKCRHSQSNDAVENCMRKIIEVMKKPLSPEEGPLSVLSQIQSSSINPPRKERLLEQQLQKIKKASFRIKASYLLSMKSLTNALRRNIMDVANRSGPRRQNQLYNQVFRVMSSLLKQIMKLKSEVPVTQQIQKTRVITRDRREASVKDLRKLENLIEATKEKEQAARSFTKTCWRTFVGILEELSNTIEQLRHRSKTSHKPVRDCESSGHNSRVHKAICNSLKNEWKVETQSIIQDARMAAHRRASLIQTVGRLLRSSCPYDYEMQQAYLEAKPQEKPRESYKFIMKQIQG